MCKKNVCSNVVADFWLAQCTAHVLDFTTFCRQDSTDNTYVVGHM